MKKRKYFVISDIHSHCKSMETALKRANFEETNPFHYLLVLGDLFDRGKEAVKTLEYLYRLSRANKATIILGNHDTFLLDFLNGEHGRVLFNMNRNGFGKTLEQLSNIEPNEENLNEVQQQISNNYPFLKDWLSSFPLYLEIENYIFVHGGIDGGKLNWKTMSTRRDFVWSRQHILPGIKDKIIVAGHHRVATIRKKSEDYHLLFLEHPDYFDILYEEGKILIDRFVEVSDEINVLTLDLEALV